MAIQDEGELFKKHWESAKGDFNAVGQSIAQLAWNARAEHERDFRKKVLVVAREIMMEIGTEKYGKEVLATVIDAAMKIFRDKLGYEKE